MSEHNHTGLDEAASVASNTMQEYGPARPFPPRQRALRQAGPMELP